MAAQATQSVRAVACTVGDLMRPAVTTVETESHLAAAAYLMNHAGQSALVVVDLSKRPVAMITEADLLRAVAHGEDTGEAYISDWMNREPQTVRPDMAVTEAAELMLRTEMLHLPVVSEGELRGIVVVGDIVDALVRTIRLASGVEFVSDLSQSLAFYQELLRYNVTASESDAALLAGADGSQLYLREVRDGRTGLQWMAWTAGSIEDLERCSEILKARGALVRRDSDEGIERVEGRDPDGLPVIVTYPGPERAPRRRIPDRVRQS